MGVFQLCASIQVKSLCVQVSQVQENSVSVPVSHVQVDSVSVAVQCQCVIVTGLALVLDH